MRAPGEGGGGEAGDVPEPVMPSMKSVAHAPVAASETRSRPISLKTASSSVSGRAAAKEWWRSALTRPLPACTFSVPSCNVTPAPWPGWVGDMIFKGL